MIHERNRINQLEGPDGHHYLERTHIVKVWRLHNPDQELQNQLDLREAAAQREEEERKLQEVCLALF